MTASAKQRSEIAIQIALDRLQQAGSQLQIAFCATNEDSVRAGRVAEALSFIGKSIEALIATGALARVADKPQRTRAVQPMQAGDSV